MTEAHKDNYLKFLQSSNNFLLVKDSMGKPKPCTRNLPDSNFTYGKKLRPDAEGVGSLLSSWAEHKSSIQPKADKDFKKLNALSVAEGAVTAPKQRVFRKEADIRVKSASQRSQIIIPDMVFGIGARPSTPIKAVISNFYGEYENEVRTGNYVPKEERPNVPANRSTKGFEMRNESIRRSMQDSKKGEFKLKKFLSVQARTSTRRNNK